MTDLITICQLINVIAGAAGLFLALLFLVVTRSRKSSLAWINRLFVCVVIAIASECFANYFLPESTATEADHITKIIVGLSMLVCAVLCVPLYRRIRRHPKYDEVQAANLQLEFTKRLFKTFLDETPSAAYVIDAYDRLLYTNGRLRQDLRVGDKDISGSSLQDWLPEAAAKEIVGLCKTIRLTRSRVEYVLVLPGEKGDRTYLLKMFPLPGPSRVPLVGVVSVEISDELRSRDMDTLLASIVELSPNAIYTLSEAGLVTSWNKGAEHMLGYTSSEIIGQSATLLAGNRNAARLAEYIRRLEAGEVIVNGGFIHFAKDGSHKRVTLSATKIKSFIGVGSSYAAIVHDETETRRAAAEMKALNRELDLKIAQLSQANKELLTARDLALEAASLKTAFVANMSHALRTPLSGILGLSEFLLEKPLAADDREMVQTINTSADALLKIVNDILDLSKFDDDRLHVERRNFSPRTMIQDCLRLLKPAAVEKGLYVNFTVDPVVPDNVCADVHKIRQVLLNLIGNAIKFTKSGGVDLYVSLCDESDEAVTLQFAVTDTGMGIAPEYNHLLFNPFSRIEKVTRGIAGSGLGLAISKRFAQLMDGNLEFSSSVGRGSTFVFSVPVQRTSALVHAAGSGQPVLFQGMSADQLRNCRVLAVEDNGVLTFLVMRQLANFGVIADSASNGGEALEKARSNRFDIILLDVNLPDMNGYEVTEKIRQMETRLAGHRHVVIAMTAGAMARDRERALAAGMDDYLAKPVNAAQLKETLMRWMVTRDGSQAASIKGGLLEEGTNRGM